MTDNRNKTLAISAIFITCVQTALVALLITQTTNKNNDLSEDDLQRISAAIESRLKPSVNAKTVALNQPLELNKSQPLNYEELATALRGVLADELAVHLTNTDAFSPQQAIPSSPETPTLTSQQIARQQEAITWSTNAVEQAIGSGTWTKSDTSTLIEYIHDLPKDTRRELELQFHTAFNQQKFRVEDFDFPSF